jgi:ABC-type nickel/cobalt efflux system permease component RcnA
MLGLDERIAALQNGEAVVVVIAVAILLGLRHATDPDHLTAVSTLIASDEERGTRRAGRLGLAWGLGHATTLFAFGLPIVLFKSYLPEWLQQGAEVAIGVVIMGLAVRLLVRWRRGRFHAHAHRHGELEHRHLHRHAGHQETQHGHRHEAESLLGRSPLQAYGIGLIHGMGGSAGVGVLLLAAISDHAVGVLALFLFALCTAISMAMASSGFGFALTRGPVAKRFLALAPALGVLSLGFGAWYVLGALDAVPYPF